MELSGECPYCGKKLYLYNRYDAECCLSCNRWTESVCGDPECSYCVGRPETPLGALAMEADRWLQSQKKDWLRHNYQHKNDGRLRHERRRSLRKDDLS